MADKALYQLPTALSATTTDLVYLEAVNAQMQEGYETKNIQAVTLAKAMLNNFTFETELTETTAKTIIGALNEIAAGGGGGGGGSTVYTGTTDPSSATGSNNDLYVKYSTSGNTTTVLAMYVKISGAWILVPFGSGGGSTVTITPALQSGTKVADYSIDGTSGSLYAPNAGSTVTITPSLATGTKVADYSIDGVSGSLYAPNGGGGSSALADLTDVSITDPTEGQILKYKPIANTETESGSVANFTTSLALPLASCVANIDYNANGVTSAKVTRTGKNLFVGLDPNLTGKFLTSIGQTGNSSSWNVSLYCPIKGGQTYYFYSGGTSGDSAKHCFYDANKGFISSIDSGTGTFVAPSNAYFMRFSVRATASDIYLVFGSTSTPYEPYQASTEYDITFGRTIYGGTLDIKNGVLTSTKAADGTDLPEPIEYDVDPTAITALAGVNNIWADTGDIEVEYVESFSDSWENANAGSSGSIFVIEMDYDGSDYTFDKTGAEIKDAIVSKMPMFLYYNDNMYFCSDAIYANPSALLDFGRFETIAADSGILEAKNIQLSIDASDNISVTESENEDKYLAFHEAHGTLTAGQTTISFGEALSDFTWHNKTLDFYTSIYGVNPTSVSFSNNNRVITLTFEAQQTDMTVKVRASNLIY